MRQAIPLRHIVRSSLHGYRPVILVEQVTNNGCNLFENDILLGHLGNLFVTIWA